ncbi:putative transporter permease protein [Fulvivirga imtechensis AK7]|uniref:Putative transporter permease protein n=1 Tax=Fulvivirga imtechensis AK7 TaxID=1237149 RepID=L8JTI2_9BACT|nr:ABC transporter permease [Fulvivirga imtechensis]ELR72276.1 putative transporter permease protein [Fulvivirga imtechensis AK7]
MLKVFFRSIKRSRISFIINLIGLSSGLACTLLIYLWVRDEMLVDKFHENDSRLYQVMLSINRNGSFQTTTATPGILAEVLQEDFSAVEDAVAVMHSLKMNTLAVDKNGFKADGIYAGESFFDIFSFDLIEGQSKDILVGQENIVISEELAMKLFGGSENILGKTIEFDEKEQFNVAGVFERVPGNSSLQFDFILPLRQFEKHTGYEISWDEMMANTYFTLNQGTAIDQFDKQLADFMMVMGIDTESAKIFARPFSDGYLYGNYEDGIQSGGRIEYIRIFSIIGIVILLIACINFVSLSTALASNRIKEVCVKKILGAKRKSIIVQHIGESTALAFIALFVSLALVSLLLPSFNEMANKQIELNWSFDMVATFVTITLLTGILSGVYPAFYISSFKPTGSSSESSNSPREQLVRKGLVSTQFVISVILIVATLVIYHQFEMIQNRNMGYNKDHIIYFDFGEKLYDQREAFLNELKKLPNVEGSSSAFFLSKRSGFFGPDGSTGHIDWPGKDPEELINVNYRLVDYDLIELMGMEMVAGRPFSEKFSSQKKEVIFNESAIDIMNLGSDPVGTIVQIWNDQYEVVGVVRNFYFESIHEGKVKPLFMMRNPSRMNTAIVKVSGKGMNNTIASIKQIYAKFNPEGIFVYNFMDQDFQRLYSGEKRMAILSRYFAGLAIIISLLGLFGLTAFTVHKKKKEISMRKVLGASSFQVVSLLYKNIVKLLLVALLIAFPVSYVLMSNWLDSYAVRVELEPWYFILAALLSFVLMLIASSIQILKVLSINPAEALRRE